MKNGKKEATSIMQLGELKQQFKIISDQVNSPNYYIWDGFRFSKA